MSPTGSDTSELQEPKQVIFSPTEFSLLMKWSQDYCGASVGSVIDNEE